MSTATGLLTIDLGAIEANWRYLCAQLNQPPAAVIKADAYGLGAEPVGRRLYQAGCREFFLATLPEALAARASLPEDARLYVLGGARSGEETVFLAHSLIPVLFSYDAVERWALLSRGQAPCALKVDTGMTRLGMSPDDWQRLEAQPTLLRDCRPEVFMSHLACADEYGHPMNRQQLERFQSLCTRARALWPGIRCSLANSSGVFLGPEWHFDLARTGAALYGYDPHYGRVPHMQPVVRLELPVLQLRQLADSADIGYGATERRPAGTRLAVVAGGYADGLNRTLGRTAVGRLGGAEVSSVGRISMDTTVFDISGAPEPEPAYIAVLDEQLTVSRVTERCGALGYEVLTSLGGRYRRHYLD